MIKDDLKILETLNCDVIHKLKMTFGEEFTNDKGEIFDIIDSKQKENLSSFIKANYYKVGCLFVVYLIQRLDLENKSNDYVQTYHILQLYLDNNNIVSNGLYRFLKSFQKSNDDFVLTFYEIEEYSYEMREFTFILDYEDYKIFLRKEKIKEILE
jgi:hypothetical protein